MLVKGDNRIIREPRAILLIQLGDIGDVVLTFPCVQALRSRFPAAVIKVAVWDKAAELIELCPWADGVIAVRKEERGLPRAFAHQWGFFRELRRHRFDLAIDLRAGTRGAFLASLSGARQRIGFYSLDGRPWRNLSFTNVFWPELPPGIHMTLYLLSLLEAYGIPAVNPRPQFMVPDSLQDRVTRLLAQEGIPADRPLIAMQPFSLWPYKEWGAAKYVALIRWLQATYGFPVLLTGSPQERQRVQEIVVGCGEQGVFNLAGKTSIGVYGALLARCGLFIGVDSAGQHLASAAGVPTVILYGPSGSSSWAPEGPEHVVVTKDFPCVPCHQMGCDNRGVSRCLEELAVEEVIPAVQRQVEKLLSTPPRLTEGRIGEFH